MPTEDLSHIQGTEINRATHDCDLSGFAYGAYGPAVDYCYESGGELWVGNGEYETRVNYCPACGFKSGKQVKN